MTIKVTEISPVRYIPMSFKNVENMQNMPIPYFVQGIFNIFVSLYMHINIDIRRLRRNVTFLSKIKQNYNMILPWMKVIVRFYRK